MTTTLRTTIVCLLICLPVHAQTIDTLPPVSGNPWTDEAEIARSPFGAPLVDPACTSAPYVTAELKEKAGIRGTDVQTVNVGRVRGGVYSNSYIGVKLGGVDSRAIDIDSFNHRDSCLFIVQDASNCESDGGHYFGARVVVYNEGALTFRQHGGTYADGFIGYLGDIKGQGSNQTLLNGTHFQHLLNASVVFRATGGRMANCIVNVPLNTKEWPRFAAPDGRTYDGTVGVVLDERCSILGGVIELSPWLNIDSSTGKPINAPSGKPATAIRVLGDNVTIETDLVDWDGLDGSIGIEIVGPRKNVKINCNVCGGFDQPHDRLLLVDDPKNCTGLDVTFRRANGKVAK